MKRTVLALLMVLASLSSWAQTIATTGTLDFDAERARLAQERKAAEATFQTEQAACYKKFAVESCLEEGRRRRRVATDAIKRQEASLNDIERKRRAAAALDQLDEKKATPRAQDTPAQQDQSREAQQGREQRAAEHETSRAQAASEAAEHQRQFGEKQRAHADDLARAARLAAEAPAERAAYERKLQQAAEHRAKNEQDRAAKTKPRSAPLPTPP